VLLAFPATTLTAAFAALAAFAAWATVATEWLRQRKARQPIVSAGFLSPPGGPESIEFVNAGQGLAIQLAYLLYEGPPSGVRRHGIVGNGHLQAGERIVVNLNARIGGKTADFVWVCRDIDQRVHIWTYDGRHERLKEGDYPTLADAFRRVYPDLKLPHSNVGAVEKSTEPGG
jgi:hypothetical protein